MIPRPLQNSGCNNCNNSHDDIDKPDPEHDELIASERTADSVIQVSTVAISALTAWDRR